jgi:hypothetical protein
MFTRSNALVVTTAATLAWSSAVLALPEVTDEEGWSGYVGAGVGYVDMESNFISGTKSIDLDTDRLNDSDIAGANSASGRDTMFPAVLGEARWTLGRRNQLFFGTSVEDAVTMDGGTQLGWRKGTDSAGTFQVSGIFNKLIPLEVYRDPFQTNKKRNDTDRYSTGLRFQWDKIFDTQFEWQLTSRKIDIDNEDSGKSLIGAPSPANPAGPVFTDADRKLLRRDADEVYTRLSYLVDLGGNHSVRPLIGYKDHDADGDANDFDSVRAQLTYAYRGDRLSVIANAAYSDRDYDTLNPVFNEEVDTDVMAFDVTAFYKLDIWDGNWAFFASGLIGGFDSDVDFYDEETTRVVSGLQYTF